MSLFAELKRRSVFRVAAAYTVVAWLLLQVGDTLAPMLRLPDWANPLLVFFLILGFPLSLFFAWAFEVTPDGIKRDSSTGAASPAPVSSGFGRKLDFIIIGLLAVALSYFVYDKYAAQRPEVHDEVTVTTERKTIAVLPFVNMSADPEQEFFSDGLSEELLNLLAKIPELRVTSRSSAFSFKGKDFKITDVGRELGVDHVLEGSVRMSGNEMRITAQLIRVSDDSHLWSDTWERTLDDVFEIQDDIAKAVVSALKIRLLGDAPHAAKTSPEAYALYLQAKSLRSTFSADSLSMALELSRQSVEADPQYAPGWVLFGEIRLFEEFWTDRPVADIYRLARMAAQKALDIDDSLASAHALMARISMNYDWDLNSARRYIQTALDLNPDDASAKTAAQSLHWKLGQFEEALSLTLRRSDVDPMSPAVHSALASAYMRLGRLDEAKAAYDKAKSISPEFFGINFYYCRYFMKTGDADTALSYCDSEADEMFRQTGLGMVHNDLGDWDKSDDSIEYLVDTCAGSCDFQIAMIYAYRDDVDLAFEWLEKAYENRDGGLPLILGLSEFDGLHDDPRFTDLMQRVGIYD